MDIWILATKSTRFVIVVKLNVSFLKVSTKRSIHWEGCWVMVVSESNKGFFVSSILAQLGLLLAKTILGNLNTLLKILLEERWIEVDFIRHLKF